MNARLLKIDPKLSAGTVLGGKYQIECLIGEGGMAYVVSAVHLKLGERVALKFLKPRALANREIMARFAHEARAAAGLKGEHIARVHDVGEREEDGAPYIVMEHLEGRDLAYVIDDAAEVRIDDAAEWMIQACAGLAEAHARGIVHCDVKPENLFLVDQAGWRSIKILDFGIAKAAAVAGATSVMGSPLYMPPEQLSPPFEVDARADIWSLGAVLFELLAKTTPFPSNTDVPTLVKAVREAPPRSLRRMRNDIPDGLEAIVARCLEKDREARFQNVAELAIALKPFAPRRARSAVERALSFNAGLKMPASVYPPALTEDPSGSASSLGGMTSALGAPSSRGTRPLPLAPSPTPEASWRWPAIASVAAAALVVVGFVSGSAREPAAPPPVTATDVAPPPPRPPPLVEVHVTSMPPGATVKENGVEVCVATPCDMAFEPNDAIHTLVFTKTGFTPQTLDVRGSVARVEVELGALPPPKY
jgi:serine/threonine-protein kinase